MCLKKKFKKALVITILSFGVFILAFVSITTGQDQDDLYFGQKPPETKPKIFAPGIVSTDASEWSITLSADGRHMFFTRWNPRKSRHASIMYSGFSKGKWTQPKIAPFSSDYHEMEATFTPDMKRLYYNSSRPYEINGKNKTSGVWGVEFSGGKWGTPYPLDSHINEKFAMMVSVAESGNIYFTSMNEKEPPDSDLFCVKLDGSSYSTRENLGEIISSSYQEAHCFIAEDEDYLIFDSNRPGGFGETDLYISFKNRQGNWEIPVNLGKPVNSECGESMPFVSPDGKYLFFTRFIKDGQGDIYWVSTEDMKGLREISYNLSNKKQKALSSQLKSDEEVEMAAKNLESLKDEIIQCVKSINQAWLGSDFIRLRDCFHEKIVIVTPDLKRVGIGIDTCIKSYEDFVSKSQIFRFEEASISVDVFGKAAVATFEYTIDYEMDKKRKQEDGKEILVFSKDSDKWLLIWRMIVAIGG